MLQIRKIPDYLSVRKLKSLVKQVYSSSNQTLSIAQSREMAFPSYLKGNALSRYFAWKKISELIKICIEFKRSKIVDYGCGCGILFPLLAKNKNTIYAIDKELFPCCEMAKILGYTDIKLLTPKKFETGIENQTIDLIIAANVLEHVPDLSSLISKFKLKLRPEGLVILCCPTENTVYKAGRRTLQLFGHRDFTGSYHRRNAADIVSQTEKCGFIRTFSKNIPGSPLPPFYQIFHFKKLSTETFTG
jgi:2-polyprenyl-3-methyl-5-hydroxy-6-metoxy-1,4-benzoquinol methylase